MIRFGLPAGVKVEPAGGMTEALTLHEKARETRIPSILFHPVKKTSLKSGIVVTPAGQTAKGTCDRICRIDRMTALFAGVKVEPAGGRPRATTLHANKKRGNISTADWESLIRRVVCEESACILRKSDRAVLDYWEHEGAGAPEGQAQLLAEALAVVEQFEKNPQGWKTLEEFETELKYPENAACAIACKSRRRRKRDPWRVVHQSDDSARQVLGLRVRPHEHIDYDSL